ncbi:hypothetical protein BX666DRAFT_566761 [Dichotomocladium elegans]|nr:hypothetical protein BX666DRAFT_566761 [Dichotomocladium elegans]
MRLSPARLGRFFHWCCSSLQSFVIALAHMWASSVQVKHHVLRWIPTNFFLLLILCGQNLILCMCYDDIYFYLAYGISLLTALISAILFLNLKKRSTEKYK